MIALPLKIKGYRSKVINGLIDYAQSITPLPSRSIRHEFWPGGILSEVNLYPTLTSVARSFDVTQTGALTIKVFRGKVYLGRLEKTIAGITFDADTGLSADVTIVPDASHNWAAWIKVDRTAASATFESGTPPGNGTPTLEYYVLAEGTTTTDDLAIKSMVQTWNIDIRDTLYG